MKNNLKNKVKGTFIKSTAMALATMVVLTGCGGSEAESSGDGSDASESSSVKAESITMGTGGTTGTYYTVGGTMGTVLNDILVNSKLTVVSSGASKSNILDIEDGIFELAIVQNDIMDYAYNGTDLFEEDGAFTSFSAVAGVYDETCQIVTSKNITSIEDLKGKVVNVGDAGSGTEFNATQILASYGIDINSDITKVNGSFSDAASSLKDGRIDAAFVTAGSPTTAIVDLTLGTTVNILSIDSSSADDLMSAYPFYTKTTIPAGTYSGIDEDIETVSVRATIIASNDLSEEIVYEITKELFENKDTLTASNAKFGELDENTAVQGISVPFHSGAEEYYQEIGILD